MRDRRGAARDQPWLDCARSPSEAACFLCAMCLFSYRKLGWPYRRVKADHCCCSGVLCHVCTAVAIA